MEALEAAQAGMFAAVPWYMIVCLWVVVFVTTVWVGETVWRWWHGR